MRGRVALTAGLALAAAVATGFAADILAGSAGAVDGDTLAIAGREIRLSGIDAPELDQVCHHRGGQSYACGRLAREHLARLVDGHTLSCEPADADAAGAVAFRCFVGPLSVNELMVANGWALADPGTGEAYRRAEAAARARKEGLWRGTFDPPWAWREAGGSAAAPAPGR